MSIVSLTALPGVANAASADDQVVSVVDALIIPNTSSATSCGRDLSTTWASEFRNDLSGTNLTSFDNREAWGVSLAYANEGLGGSLIATAVYIYWWEAADLPDTATFKFNDRLVADPTRWGSLSIDWVNCTVDGSVFSSTSAHSIAAIDPYDSQYYTRPFLLHGISVDYPSGYEGEIIPSTFTPPAPTYVAMGDSFSSGEGNEPFIDGTDSISNECHRSQRSYPRILQVDMDLGLGPANFIACSGATTNDVLGVSESDNPVGRWGAAAQVDALSNDTEVVTITIGGNDIGFSDYATTCAFTLCGPGTTGYNSVMSAINDTTFHSNLVETYETIVDTAPNAQVYVTGYPHIAASNSGWCGTVDLAGAWAVVNQLNAVIEAAVGDAATSLSTTTIHFVDPNGTGSPFAGRHLCNGGASDFNHLVVPPNVEYSFHPNVTGQQHYSVLIKDAM